MKNLLIYVNPQGFDLESEKLAKIQIENSLEIGWKPNDIILVTNFPYEYMSVKAKEIEGGYCDFQKEASKITTLVHLFDKGLIDEKQLYWLHDLDAYQLEEIKQEELGIDDYDAGFCDYTRISRIQMGTFFFWKRSEDIFRAIVDKMTASNEYGAIVNDEDAINKMIQNNENDISKRIKILDGRYDFGMRRIDYCYQKITKPIKILHFHPYHPRNGVNNLKSAMHGINSIKMPLMNERLINIFNKHGYT